MRKSNWDLRAVAFAVAFWIIALLILGHLYIKFCSYLWS